MMTFLTDRLAGLDAQFCLLLTWALVHFVWQGCLLAAGFAVARGALPARRPTPAMRPACSLCS